MHALSIGHHNHSGDEQIAVSRRISLPYLKTLLLAYLLIYIVMFGGLWLNIRSGTYNWVSVPLAVILVISWLLYKLLFRLPIAKTVLDASMPLWILAFLVSTVANPENIVRVTLGLFVCGLYITFWYLLNDLIARRVISANMVYAALLLTGMPVIASTLAQIGYLGQPSIERLFGVLENANSLGAFLILLIPLIVALIQTGTPLLRVFGFLYLIPSVLALYWTGTRGAWLGVLIAAGVVLFQYRRRRVERIAFLLLGAALATGLLTIRGDNGRLLVYQLALERIAAQPITGGGLLSFQLLDPFYDQNIVFLGGINLHAHNLFLHAGVEMGVFGIVAMAVTVYLLMKQPAPQSTRGLWAYGALAGLFFQHLFDFPIIMPAIAFPVIALLAAVFAHSQGERDKSLLP